MPDLVALLMLSVVIEALIEYFNLIAKKKLDWKQLAAIFIAIALAVLSQQDLLAMLGITFVVPYVGMVLTGIFLSRGSNYVADLIKKIQTPKVGDSCA